MADLRDIGLSEYEAQVYRSLLDTGPSTAKQLSETSGVPMGRIYDVLNDVEGQGLVRTQSTSRPKKYVAVEPDAALDRLLEARERELAAKADQYEEVVEDLKRSLDAPRIQDDRFWTAALGPEETLDLVEERLDAAEDRIFVVAGAPGPGFDVGEVSERFTGRLADALDRGVDIRLLMDDELVTSVPDAVLARYTDAFSDAGMTARVCDDLDGSFTVIDDAELCLEVPSPLDRSEMLATVNLKDATFTERVVASVETRWEEAEPL